MRNYALNQIGDTLADDVSGFGTDDDPELIAAAAPFNLKLMESMLRAIPEHRGLLLATARGFVQYAYAFVELKADEFAETRSEATSAERARAARLYLRARDYGLRGLEAAHPGFTRTLRAEPAAALAVTRSGDISLLYWTGVAWAAAVSPSQDDLVPVADLALAEALVRRVLALDEAYDQGAAHVFMISFEMGLAGRRAGAAERARRHYARAVELTAGRAAAPYVAYAEAVSIPERNRAEFQHLLQGVLKMDVHARPEWRLVNRLLQRRARWLLDRTDRLFFD